MKGAKGPAPHRESSLHISWRGVSRAGRIFRAPTLLPRLVSFLGGLLSCSLFVFPLFFLPPTLSCRPAPTGGCEMPRRRIRRLGVFAATHAWLPSALLSVPLFLSSTPHRFRHLLWCGSECGSDVWVSPWRLCLYMLCVRDGTVLRGVRRRTNVVGCLVVVGRGHVFGLTLEWALASSGQIGRIRCR
jgi:hypothetical protein